MPPLVDKLREEAKAAYEKGKQKLEEAREELDEGEELDEKTEEEIDRAFDKADKKAKRADRIERQKRNERKLNGDEPAGEDVKAGRLPMTEEALKGLQGEEDDVEDIFDTKSPDEQLTPEQKKAVGKYVRHGTNALTAEQKSALNSISDPDGGYIAPGEFRQELIQKTRDMVHIRERARVITTSRSSIGFPAWDHDIDVPTRAEGESMSGQDITDALGKTEFTPHKRSDIFKVPEELLEDDVMDIQSFLTDEFSERFAEIEEGDFIQGDGDGEPLGILNVPNLRNNDVSNTDTPSADDILDAQYDLRKVHRRSNGAGYMMHRNVVRAVRKEKDNDDQYLWQPGLQAGEPATLAGFPLLESEFMPDPTNGGSDGDPVFLFGDWSNYWIVDRTDLSIMRLDEKYRDEGKIGIRIRKRTDAAPVKLDPFVRYNHT